MKQNSPASSLSNAAHGTWGPLFEDCGLAVGSGELNPGHLFAELPRCLRHRTMASDCKMPPEDRDKVSSVAPEQSDAIE